MSASPDDPSAVHLTSADGAVRRQSGVRVPDTRIGLSTASVYPEGVGTAFEMARDVGYDGVEVMVWTDPVSQDMEQIASLSDRYAMPVLAIHAPCLLITQRVWSTDPWERLRRSLEAADKLGAPTVVVHPPFRWQRDYARDFVEGVARLEAEHGIAIAVENMYPWRAGKRELPAYAPHWDPTDQDYAHNTLDLSHTAVSGTNALGMAEALGDRLAHLHMADGTSSARDEHLVPGRGDQPCVEILEFLAGRGWSGTIILEVGTRRARNADERLADLAEALAFTRLHLATAIETAFAVGVDGTAEQVVRDARQ